MAKLTCLLQDLSYCWAGKQDNCRFVSSLLSSALGAPLIKLIRAARVRRGRLHSAATIPARTG